MFGPYWTGRFTPAGAGAVVTCPQPQRLRCNRCSTVCAVTFGMSVTCLADTPTSPASARSAPHPPHAAGWWSMTLSGVSVRRNAKPCPPGCFPGLRPALACSRRAADRSNLSVDGGSEEFREFCPSRRFSSVTSARKSATVVSSSWIFKACAATNAASSSYVDLAQTHYLATTFIQTNDTPDQPTEWLPSFSSGVTCT